MSWVRERRRFRASAAIALLCVAFYTLLIPVHLTSQAVAQPFMAAALWSGSICHGAGTDADKPAAPSTSCPFCKGLAAFQLVTPVIVQLSLPVVPQADPAMCERSQEFAAHAAPAPRSRGPPRAA